MGLFKNITTCYNDTGKIQKQYIVILIFIACFSRICTYFFNRDLWLDELFLVESLQKMDTWELLSLKLLNLQSAPMGYLLISEFLSNIFFNSYMLHLVSLISGLALIFISYKFMEKYFDRLHTVLYLACFVINASLNYYSVEFKQYMTEALLSFFMVCYYMDNKKEICVDVSYTFLFILMFVNIFSTSIPFVIGGITCAVIYELGSIKNVFTYIKRNSIKIIIFFVFYLLYFKFYLSTKTTIGDMQDVWSFTFLPLDSSLFLTWFKDSFLTVMGVLTYIPLTIKGYPVGGIFFLVFFIYGACLLLRNNKDLFFCTVVPLGFVLFASALKMYPIGHTSIMGTRLMVFIFPLLLIPVTVSIMHLMKTILKKDRFVTFALTGPVIMALIINLIFVVQRSKGIEESSRLVSDINKSYTDEMALLVWVRAIPAYTVYSYGNEHEYTHFTANDDLDVMVSDFLREKKMVMMFYSHFYHDIEDTIDSLRKSNLRVIRIQEKGAELIIVSRQ